MTLTAPPQSFDECLARLAPLRDELLNHRVYSTMKNDAALGCFMEYHLWAVWDFMAILKAIQAQFSCIGAPWVPQGDPTLRRFVNEIVLTEESDQTSRGYLSHFELYCLAIEEVGADPRAVMGVVEQLRQGVSSTKAMAACTGPGADFSRQTLKIVEQGSPAELVGVFAFAREELIPDLFRQVVAQLVRGGGRAHLLLEYLERHIGVDEDEHGPLARKMMEAVCGERAEDWERAFRASEKAFRARLALWDAAFDSATQASAGHTGSQTT
ncbi:MAG: DUF3050 domain-containing protein [Myxococcota bacterium]|nr:DUF3050 domain-containing protein [Myxococcota bacterium]